MSLLQNIFAFAKNIMGFLSPENKRMVLGELAAVLPYGSVTTLSEITGVSRNTISKGKNEALASKNDTNTCNSSDSSENTTANNNINKQVNNKNGRPKCEYKQPYLLNSLHNIVKDCLYTDEFGNVYCSLSVRNIAKQLNDRGFIISHSTVSEKLNDLNINKARCKKIFNDFNKSEYNDSKLTLDNISNSELFAHCDFDEIVDHFFEQDAFISKYNYSSFDYVVDHFLDQEFSYSYFYADFECFFDHFFDHDAFIYIDQCADFDCVVDHFFDHEAFISRYQFADFDCVVDHFFDYDAFIYLPLLADFDHTVDHFFDYKVIISSPIEDPEVEIIFSDEEIKRILLISSFCFLQAENSKVKERRIKNRKGKHSWKYARRPVGGRNTVVQNYPLIKLILSYIVDKYTYGNPEKPLLWTSKSQRKLADALKLFNIFVCHRSIAKLLREMGYSLKRNRKLEQVGEKHPDADLQMRIIENKIETFAKLGIPIISIDCKKKEMIGNFANKGEDYVREPIIVNDHDFRGDGTLVAAPYGIYDISLNEGYINVGFSSDTPEFAVNSIDKWWNERGSKNYKTKDIFILSDGGGSNSYRSIRFKQELQKFANKYGLRITFSHYPTGKSKYNKIEHRLFSLISNNWRGHPLKDIETMMNYIVSTKSTKGLKVFASIDTREYKTGIRSSKKDLKNTLVLFDDTLGQWNYTIYPENRREEVQEKIDRQWKSIEEQEKEKKKNKDSKKNKSKK